MLPPEFKTENYTIKGYEPTDEDRFVEITLDEVCLQFMGGASGDEAEERALFKKILEIYKRNEKRWFWIWGVYKADILLAHLEMKTTDHTNEDELEIVYMVHPEGRRKGLMTEVLAFLKANQTSWNKRIIATVSPENKNSIKLLEKWGIAKKELLTDEETGKTYFKLVLNQ